jgi:CheY-like chemotaxis protein
MPVIPSNIGVRLGRLRFLLVDDNDAVRAVLGVLLATGDHVVEIREAGDGIEAIEECGTFEPDVVILDQRMPRMDGAEAAELIRAMYPKAKIVAFSSELDEKPRWADVFFPKDTIPEPESLIELGNGGRTTIVGPAPAGAERLEG